MYLYVNLYAYYLSLDKHSRATLTHCRHLHPCIWWRLLSSGCRSCPASVWSTCTQRGPCTGPCNPPWRQHSPLQPGCQNSSWLSLCNLEHKKKGVLSKTSTVCATNFYPFWKIKITPKRHIFGNAPIDTNILSLPFSYFELNLAALHHQTALIELSKEQAAKSF